MRRAAGNGAAARSGGAAVLVAALIKEAVGQLGPFVPHSNGRLGKAVACRKCRRVRPNFDIREPCLRKRW